MVNGAMHTVVLATANPHKLVELRELLAGVSVCWQSLADVPALTMPEETGGTFAENARIKAEAVARATGHWALADDSGLCVDALGGAPGVLSARYAGTPTDAARNIAKLMTAMRAVPVAARTASFCCVMALAGPDGSVHCAEGRCAGTIAMAPQGHGGFGYDPVFWVEAHRKTMAELTPAEKHRISHRAHAALLMREILARFLPPDTSSTGCGCRASTTG